MRHSTQQINGDCGHTFDDYTTMREVAAHCGRHGCDVLGSVRSLLLAGQPVQETLQYSGEAELALS